MNRFTQACTSLAAFVVFAVLPATASATNNPILTAPTGTQLAKGAAITGFNVGHIVFTGPKTEVLFECATATMNGTIHKNDHTGVEGNITAASFTSSTDAHGHTPECKGSSGPVLVTTNVADGLPYCLRSTPTMATDAFIINGGECTKAERPINIQLHITSAFGNITCNYSNPVALTGTLTTHPNAAIATIGHQEFERTPGSSFLCPVELFLDMSVALKSGANTVYVGDVT